MATPIKWIRLAAPVRCGFLTNIDPGSFKNSSQRLAGDAFAVKVELFGYDIPCQVIVSFPEFGEAEVAVRN